MSNDKKHEQTSNYLRTRERRIKWRSEKNRDNEQLAQEHFEQWAQLVDHDQEYCDQW